MNYKIIHLTDLHGTKSIITNIEGELRSADIIILSGDITHFGNSGDASSLLNTISSYNTNIYAVAGNCDNMDIDDLLSEKGINLNRNHIERDDLIFCGLGGSLPCPGRTPFEFTEQKAEKWLSNLKTDIALAGKPILFVSHQPPVNTICDQLIDGQHVGSISVREFIQFVSPVLCLTGHIHEGIGIDTIGNCKVVNPGPFRAGHYASITITGENSVNIELKQITPH